MTSLELATALAAELPTATVITAFGQSAAVVPLHDWTQAARLARTTLDCQLFDWLGIEDAGRPGASGASYTVNLQVLHPSPWRSLMLRTELRSDQGLPSLAEFWAGAAWHEREAAEMFGISLENHPNPNRLLLAPSFAGHPLRKDFVLASRVVRPWPGALEPGEANANAPSRRRLAPPGVPDPAWGPRQENAHG